MNWRRPPISTRDRSHSPQTCHRGRPGRPTEGDTMSTTERKTVDAAREALERAQEAERAAQAAARWARQSLDAAEAGNWVEAGGLSDLTMTNAAEAAAHAKETAAAAARSSARAHDVAEAAAGADRSWLWEQAADDPAPGESSTS